MKNALVFQVVLKFWILAAACSSMLIVGGGCEREPVQGRSKVAGELVCQIDGVQTKIPLLTLEVYLTDDDTQPELFELSGQGLLLAGLVPANARIGYESAWQRLIGKPIPLDPRSKTQIQIDQLKAMKVDLPPERLKGYPLYSIFTLPDKTAASRILGGSFVVEKITGTNPGLDGDRAVHGKIEIRVQDGSGEKVLHGTFKVQCLTWG